MDEIRSQHSETMVETITFVGIDVGESNHAVGFLNGAKWILPPSAVGVSFRLVCSCTREPPPFFQKPTSHLFPQRPSFTRDGPTPPPHAPPPAPRVRLRRRRRVADPRGAAARGRPGGGLGPRPGRRRIRRRFSAGSGRLEENNFSGFGFRAPGHGKKRGFVVLSRLISFSGEMCKKKPIQSSGTRIDF